MQTYYCSHYPSRLHSVLVLGLLWLTSQFHIFNLNVETERIIRFQIFNLSVIMIDPLIPLMYVTESRVYHCLLTKSKI